KRDAAHAMNECLVAQKYACNYKADHISRQDCFALRGGREAAEKEKNGKDKLYFRFAYPRRSKPIDDRLCPLWHKPEHDTHDDDEDEQPNVEVCKEPAKREHRAEISNETSRENHFAHRGVAVAAFDHHGVNHRN